MCIRDRLCIERRPRWLRRSHAVMGVHSRRGVPGSARAQLRLAAALMSEDWIGGPLGWGTPYHDVKLQ
eukprot:65038-Alexandrium_andersonii.AAC.1